MEIKDQIVLVTGGANGIGRALCERFAAEGAERVYVADVELANAEEVAARIGGHSLALDVGNEDSCRKAVETIISETGRLDFVASNAGIGGDDGSLDVSNESWQRIHEINVMSHVYLARYAIPPMVERGAGGFMITASAAGLLTHPTAMPYAVTKHAAVAVSESLSIEFGDAGVYVSCLCPQGVKTRLIATPDGMPENFLMSEAITVEQCADAVISALRAETFLILPHPEVAEYIVNKATNYDRWIKHLRRMRREINGMG